MPIFSTQEKTIKVEENEIGKVKREKRRKAGSLAEKGAIDEIEEGHKFAFKLIRNR